MRRQITEEKETNNCSVLEKLFLLAYCVTIILSLHPKLHKWPSLKSYPNMESEQNYQRGRPRSLCDKRFGSTSRLFRSKVKIAPYRWWTFNFCRIIRKVFMDSLIPINITLSCFTKNKIRYLEWRAVLNMKLIYNI